MTSVDVLLVESNGIDLIIVLSFDGSGAMDSDFTSSEISSH